MNLHNLFSLISTNNTPNLCKNHLKDPEKCAILGFYTIFDSKYDYIMIGLFLKLPISFTCNCNIDNCFYLIFKSLFIHSCGVME